MKLLLSGSVDLDENVCNACHRVKNLCFQVGLAEHQVMPKHLEYFSMEFIGWWKGR